MKHRRSPNRPDRTTAPHSRIPDSIYADVLPFITPAETKLWLALKSREWRKDGTRRGIVKKSLNRIAADIRMSRVTVQRAFRGLRMKGLVEWAGFGIRLLNPSFTTAVTTGFTTGGLRRRRLRNGPGVAHLRAASDIISEPPATIISFPLNESGCGRSDLTIRRARDEPARAVEAPEGLAEQRLTRKRARVRSKLPRASDNADSEREDKAEMRDENDSGELDAKPLTRSELHEFLGKLRAHVEAEAAKTAAEQEARSAIEEKKRDDRIRELHHQADELAKEDS